MNSDCYLWKISATTGLKCLFSKMISSLLADASDIWQIDSLHLVSFLASAVLSNLKVFA